MKILKTTSTKGAVQKMDVTLMETWFCPKKIEEKNRDNFINLYPLPVGDLTTEFACVKASLDFNLLQFRPRVKYISGGQSEGKSESDYVR